MGELQLSRDVIFTLPNAYMILTADRSDVFLAGGLSINRFESVVSLSVDEHPPGFTIE